MTQFLEKKAAEEVQIRRRSLIAVGGETLGSAIAKFGYWLGRGIASVLVEKAEEMPKEIIAPDRKAVRRRKTRGSGL